VHRQFAAAHPNSITPDEVYGAQLAVNHLIQLGHRRIGFITGPEEYYASHDRLQGYQIELAKASIPLDVDLVTVADWETSGGYTATQELLQQSSPPTAIFAGNDLMAIGAIYAARDAGLTVPQDLGVVGYDDIQIAAVFRPGIMPGITTVTLPCYEMGQASAQLLLDQLQGRGSDQEEVKIRGRLIVRDSCGARLQESLHR
jgi:DNA-binding LacI/PurR family transcriptional regulator